MRAKAGITAALEAGDHGRVAVLAAELHAVVKRLAEEAKARRAREERTKVLKQKMLEALEALDYDAVAALGGEFAALEKEEQDAAGEEA